LKPKLGLAFKRRR